MLEERRERERGGGDGERDGRVGERGGSVEKEKDGGRQSSILERRLQEKRGKEDRTKERINIK